MCLVGEAPTGNGSIIIIMPWLQGVRSSNLTYNIVYRALGGKEFPWCSCLPCFAVNLVDDTWAVPAELVALHTYAGAYDAIIPRCPVQQWGWRSLQLHHSWWEWRGTDSSFWSLWLRLHFWWDILSDVHIINFICSSSFTVELNLDTNGTEESVHISEVSLFQGLNCMQELFLGEEKVSLLERCPHFRSVLGEGFNSIIVESPIHLDIIIVYFRSFSSPSSLCETNL